MSKNPIILTSSPTTHYWCFPLIAFTCKNTVKNIFFFEGHDMAWHVMAEGNFVRTIDWEPLENVDR